MMEPPYVMGMCLRRFVYCLFVLPFLFSCGRHSHNDVYHRAYFEPLFTVSDSIAPENPGKALRLLDSAYAAFPAAGLLDLSHIYAYKASYYQDIPKDYDKAKMYHDSIIYLFKDKLTDPDYIKVYSRALLGQGDILIRKGRYTDAFLHFYEGKQVVQQSHDTCYFNEFSLRLAYAYYTQGKFRDAIPFFRETFGLAGHCTENPFMRFALQQGQLDNLGLCYAQLKVYDSARYFYDSALRYIDKWNGTFVTSPSRKTFVETAKAVIYGNLGETSLAVGDTASGERLFKESIRINERKANDPDDAQFTRIKLATLYLSQGRHDEAREVLKTLKQYVDSLPRITPKLRLLKLQSKYFDETGEVANAYAALQSYTQLKDSVTSANEALSLVDIRKEFEHMSQDREIEVLKRQSELKTLYLIIVLLFFVMTAIIVFQTWRNWKKSREHVKELEMLNQRVTAQNEYLEESLNALEQSQQDNSKMMKIVAHDLRNPVGAMITITDILQQYGGITEEKNQELLRMMKESGDRALHLINDLLHLKISQEAQKETMEVHVMLKYCVDMLQARAREKGQQILLETIPAVIPVNREKIWRVFSNLISNAIKFSPSGTTIHVWMEQEDTRLRIAVEDEGIGIPEELKEKIFSMPHETRRAGTLGEESFGLGLAISKQIVEAHGGRIWVENKNKKGTIFYVELMAPSSLNL